MLGRWHWRALEVLLTGAGSVIAVALGGESAWGIVGAFAGLLVGLGIEAGAIVRARLRRLSDLERDIDSIRREQELLRQQAVLARREAAVSEAWTEVFGGVVSEAISTGRIVPLDALMARAQVTLKSRGLDTPLAFPPTNPPLPGA